MEQDEEDEFPYEIVKGGQLIAPVEKTNRLWDEEWDTWDSETPCLIAITYCRCEFCNVL